MITALLALFLADVTAADSYRAILALHAEANPEPEPPPGLRAPADSKRRRRAVAQYQADLAAWAKAETARRRRIVALATAHLERFPKSARAADVLSMRATAYLGSGNYTAARRDLERYVGLGGETTQLKVARGALVACCRAMGDYPAALEHAGPAADADLMEEAGQIARAIRTAKSAGDHAKAARWKLIGCPFPGEVQIPAGARAFLLEAGKRLPERVKEALRREFGEKNLDFGFTSGTEPAIYLLDGKGMVRAVDARSETLSHRIRRILEAD